MVFYKLQSMNYLYLLCHFIIYSAKIKIWLQMKSS